MQHALTDQTKDIEVKSQAAKQGASDASSELADASKALRAAVGEFEQAPEKQEITHLRDVTVLPAEELPLPASIGDSCRTAMGDRGPLRAHVEHQLNTGKLTDGPGTDYAISSPVSDDHGAAAAEPV